MSMLRAADSIRSAVIPFWDRDEGLGDLSGGTRGEEPSVEAGSPETPCLCGLALSRLLSTPASRLGEGVCDVLMGVKGTCGWGDWRGDHRTGN